MIYFSEDGNSVLVTCAVCGVGCDTLKFDLEGWDEETWGFINVYGGRQNRWTLWHRLKALWRMLRGNDLWPEALEIGWREEHREGIRKLGEWLVEKSQEVGPR